MTLIYSTGDELLVGQNVRRSIALVLNASAHPRPPKCRTPHWKTTSRGAQAFLHVCNYWRAILLGHCKAWSNIHLKGQVPGLFAWQMTRTRDAPLNVTIHLHDRVLNSEGSLLHTFYASVKTIRQHRHRIRTLSASATRFHSFQNLFNFELLSLKELAWEGTGLGRPTRLSGPVWDMNRCPKLRCLSVKGTLDWPMKATTGLAKFKLESLMTVTIKDISGFFHDNQVLKALEFINLTVPVPILGETRPTKLPNLPALSCCNVAHGSGLPSLSLPAIENLSIRPSEGPLQWSPTIWSTLSIPVRITSPNVKHPGWVSGFDRICVTGSDDTYHIHVR